MKEAALLFALRGYEDLAQSLSHLANFELGEVERKEFPDGEHYRRLATRAAGRAVVLLGGSVSDESTLELYDLACALVYDGARSLTIVMPFFGYSTMERAVRPGEVVTAKARARLYSSIPQASMGNRIFMMDLHVEGITHYFEGSLQPIHLSARKLIEKIACSLGGDDFVLACTDAGRAKWVEGLANTLGVTAAFAYKRRVDGENTEVIGVSAHVQGKKVVIYDDMIRTGSSLIGAAQAYKDAGATEISALCTHGVFPNYALERLEASGLFAKVACTDTHPRANELRGSFLEVYSVAELLQEGFSENILLGA